MSLCFILTAGQGTRLRPYTEQKPKPAIPFLTLPLAAYGFYLARKAGFDHFIMNKHHLPHEVEYLRYYFSSFTTKVETVDETKELLGSGGALWNAREILSQQDFFLVANGDEVLIPPKEDVLKRLSDLHCKQQPLATLLTCDHPDLLTKLKAVWINDKGEVRGFGKESPEPGLKPVHYTGYKVFSKEIFRFLPAGESNIFYDVLVNAISKGEIVNTYHLDSSSWHETGDFSSYLSATHAIADEHWDDIQNRREFFGLSPLHKINKNNSIFIYSDTKDERLFENCQDVVVLGHNCKIAPDTQLKNIIADNNSQLNSSSKGIIFGSSET